MTRKRCEIAAALLALGAALLVVNPAPIRAQGPEIEPEAAQLLQRMTDYLGGLKRFSMDTDNMLEDVLVTGQKIQYDFNASVWIQRPNNLRADRAGDQFRQVVVYDGATLAIHNPDDGYFARTEATPSIC
jgi:hypothetical protein